MKTNKALKDYAKVSQEHSFQYQLLWQNSIVS